MQNAKWPLSLMTGVLQFGPRPGLGWDRCVKGKVCQMRFGLYALLLFLPSTTLLVLATLFNYTINRLHVHMLLLNSKQ